jgi:hypothetical protein
MKRLWILSLFLLLAACNKDKNKERTGIEDHPKGNTNLSGMDASGPASSRTNPAPSAK